MSDTALETIAQQTWLDPLAEPLSDAVHRAYDAAGETGRRLKNAAHGTWLGHPLHSAVTDIPLGAWATALVLDIADVATGDRGYGRSADVAIGFGLAGAAGAAVTGLTDWSETDGSAKRLGLTHALVNIAATALFATSLAARLNGNRASGRRLSVAGLLAVSAGAYIGGALVYGKRIGVTHADEGGAESFTPVLASGELTEGTKRKVDAGGTAVMVARQHGEACALAEHCSHLGGPLSEGTLKDGSVVCPWHGSEFGLADGRVINGPATNPQPCFETREENGAIEVRRR